MKLESTSIKNGYFKPEFGKHGSEFTKGGKPSRSFQLTWSDLPPKTKSLALIFIDHDAIPTCGFSWLHWAVANINPTLNELPENASQTLDLLEGVTSWSAPFTPADFRVPHDDDAQYGGPAPPDSDHLYTIQIYALDTFLDLKRGFYMNALIKAMNGHILDESKLEGWYAR